MPGHCSNGEQSKILLSVCAKCEEYMLFSFFGTRPEPCGTFSLTTPSDGDHFKHNITKLAP